MTRTASAPEYDPRSEDHERESLFTVKALERCLTCCLGARIGVSTMHLGVERRLLGNCASFASRIVRAYGAGVDQALDAAGKTELAQAFRRSYILALVLVEAFGMRPREMKNEGSIFERVLKVPLAAHVSDHDL
jgi:hypothetical protein